MKFVEFRDIPVGAVQIGPRLREVDADWAEALAAMIAQTGLQHPIEVILAGATRYTLIAGAHRLAAVKLLGWPEIPARIVEPETENVALEARLHEIVENIGRRELSALDRAAHVAELSVVYGQLYPEPPRGGDRRSKTAKINLANLANLKNWPFRKEIAAKTGLSERTIRRAVDLIRRLHPEVVAMLRAHRAADNGAALGYLAGLSKDRQIEEARAILEGKPFRNQSDKDWAMKIFSDFSRAGSMDRRRALLQIGVSEPEAERVVASWRKGGKRP